jgi:hypothetical protein
MHGLFFIPSLLLKFFYQNNEIFTACGVKITIFITRI